MNTNTDVIPSPNLQNNAFSSCFYSSFIFLVNTIICYYYEYAIYAGLFFVLFCTSIVFHSKKTNVTFWIDRIAVISVILYGGYIFLENYRK